LSGRRHAKHDGYQAATPLGAPLKLWVGRSCDTEAHLDGTKFNTNSKTQSVTLTVSPVPCPLPCRPTVGTSMAAWTRTATAKEETNASSIVQPQPSSPRQYCPGGLV